MRLGIFLIFFCFLCMNLQQRLRCFSAKSGSNGPKMRFFKFYKYLTLKMFEFFCIKLRSHIGLKLTFVFLFFCTYTTVKTQDWLKWIFFFFGGGMLFWSFFMTKMRFFKFLKKSTNLFWFFSVMLQQHKGFRFYHVFTGKKFLLGFLTRISPKWFC